MMNLKCFAILFIGISIILSCSTTKDNRNTSNNLIGEWIEKSPISGRTELIFMGENQLIKKTDPNEVSVTFSYEILNDSIELSRNEADGLFKILFFRLNDNNRSFSIGNFLNSEPIDEILIFQKK